MSALWKQHGTKTFRLSTPEPRLTRRRDDVDTLVESWQWETDSEHAEGDVHPNLSGMIIDQLQIAEEIPGAAYVVQMTSLGSYDGSQPTKVIGRGDRRSLDAGWDESYVDYMTWQANERACTAVASTDIVSCSGHTFANGQRIVFLEISGGAGLTAMAESSLPTVYFVINTNIGAGTFQVSLTAGGSAVDITSDMTAGYVQAAEFAPGAVHPDHANMWLVNAEITDAYTDWKRVRAIYRGMRRVKPYKRIITVNGQSFSASEKISWAFDDGWTDRYGQFDLPKIQCTDLYLTTSALATTTIPYSQTEGGSPPNPPSIRSIVLTSYDADLLTYHWPAGWSRVDESHVDSIPFASVNLKRRVSEYRWPVTFK